MEQSDSEKNLKLEIKKLKEKITSLEKMIKKLETPNRYSSYYWDNDKRYAKSIYEVIVGFRENDKSAYEFGSISDMFHVQKVQRLRVFSPVWGFAVPDETSPSGIKCLYFDSKEEAKTEAKKRMREAGKKRESRKAGSL